MSCRGCCRRRQRGEYYENTAEGMYHGDTEILIYISSKHQSVPPPYARRPPHIHILVDMRGYAGLITRHYPGPGQRRATFDLTMETE